MRSDVVFSFFALLRFTTCLTPPPTQQLTDTSEVKIPNTENEGVKPTFQFHVVAFDSSDAVMPYELYQQDEHGDDYLDADETSWYADTQSPAFLVKWRRKWMTMLAVFFVVIGLHVLLFWNDESDRRSVWFSEVQEQQSMLVPSILNFTITYNFSNMGSLVLLMKLGYITHAEPIGDYFEGPLLIAVFLGSCIGVLAIGVCGDVVGRQRSLQLCLWIAAFGALLPVTNFCVFTIESYWLHVFFRFLVGIGTGGLLPLSAVLANDDTQGLIPRAVHAGRAYFWAAPGLVAPVFITLALAEILPRIFGETSEYLPWLLLLVLTSGALPCILLIFVTWGSPDPVDAEQVRTSWKNMMQIVKENPKHCFTLFGTGSTWFIQNVVMFGTWVHLPNMVMWSEDNMSLRQVEIKTASLSLMAIPGILVTISLIQQLGLRLLNVLGFLLQASLLFISASIGPEQLQLRRLLTFLFCFAVNTGPAVGTYVLPTLSFPTQIRSSFHALSALCGKFGAMMGIAMWAPIVENCGVNTWFVVQGFLCVLGALLSVAFLRRDTDYTDVNSPLLGVKRQVPKQRRLLHRQQTPYG